MNKSVLIAGILLAFAGGASAATYTNVPGGANNGLPFAYFGNGANPSGDSPMVGEVFSLSSDSVLSSFSFYAIGNTSASFQLYIAEWNPGTNVLNQAVNLSGSTLLTKTGVDSFNGSVTTLSFDNLGLSLE